MRIGVARVLGASVLVLAFPSTAVAAYECVPSILIAGCPTSAAGEPTITAAVTNGQSGDTIVIGPGTYSETVTDAPKALTFVGAGPASTIIQGQGNPAMTISAGSSVSNLGIDLYKGTGNTGLSLAGSATNVAVTATQPLSTTNNTGVALSGSGTFAHGTVTLPLTGGDGAGFGGVVGSGTVSDSTITAAVGVAGDSGGAGNLPALHRDRIVANQAVLAGASPVTIDDTVIRTEPGAAVETGLGTSPLTGSATVTARHLTIVGSGGAGSIGVDATASTPALSTTTNVLLAASIIRGFATSIRATASEFGPFTATTIVQLQHTFYDPTTAHAAPTPPASASISADLASGNVDPLFVNAAADDFHLQAGSPAIDAALPGLETGESATDLDGHPRLVAGHAANNAVSDIGAFEFIPHPPAVSASAAASVVTLGQPVTFAAAGSDVSPGDTVTFTWRFDDGTSAAGASAVHTFATAGPHSATVTATDLDGFTASASASVSVAPMPHPKPPPRPPALSKLALKPSRFRARAGTTISYSDSRSATTRFSVLAARSGKLIATFAHHDHAGRNRFHLSVRFHHRLLAPGPYRLQAVPRNAAGSGHASFARFQVQPPPRRRHR